MKTGHMWLVVILLNCKCGLNFSSGLCTVALLHLKKRARAVCCYKFVSSIIWYCTYIYKFKKKISALPIFLFLSATGDVPSPAGSQQTENCERRRNDFKIFEDCLLLLSHWYDKFQGPPHRYRKYPRLHRRRENQNRKSSSVEILKICLCFLKVFLILFLSNF